MKISHALRILGLAVGILQASAVFAAKPEGGIEVDVNGARYISGTVERIADGDTIAVRARGFAKPVKIRMVGEDTAELHLIAGGKNHSQGWWAEVGYQTLLSMIPIGSQVRVRVYGEDVYGRTLGRVFDSKGKDMNLEMVRLGWGALYVYCSGAGCTSTFFADQDVDQYVKACEEAVREARGIFDARDPLKEMPFEFRMRLQGRVPEKFVGDYDSKVLFRPRDYVRVPLCHRVFFAETGAAERMGYRSGK